MNPTTKREGGRPMTTQHTAAPWETLEIHDGIAIKDNRNVTIAYCGYATEADDIISSLIAIHEEDETDVPSIVTIRAAIAKAKGPLHDRLQGVCKMVRRWLARSGIHRQRPASGRAKPPGSQRSAWRWLQHRREERGR